MRFAVAALLLTAAGLKGHALLFHPLSPGSPLWSRPMEHLAVGFEIAITLHNRGRQAVRVVGGTTDCGCLATSDLPVSISPGGQVEIRVQFKRSGQPGVFKRGFWLYTDAPRQPFVVAWFAGRIVAP